MSTLVVGVGSPHGDDRAGWKLVELLAPHLPTDVRAITLVEPLRLLDELAGVERLILVDACRSGMPAGSIVRLTWPDPTFATRHSHSTHGFSVAAVLALADQLGRLPPVVVAHGIEASTDGALEEISPAVARALLEVCQQISGELGIT